MCRQRLLHAAGCTRCRLLHIRHVLHSVIHNRPSLHALQTIPLPHYLAPCRPLDPPAYHLIRRSCETLSSPRVRQLVLDPGETDVFEICLDTRVAVRNHDSRGGNGRVHTFLLEKILDGISGYS